MHLQLTQFFLALATTALCAIAFASDPTDGVPLESTVLGSTAPLTQERVLVAQAMEDTDDATDRRLGGINPDRETYVYACNVLNDSSFSTKKLLITQALKLIALFPTNWFLGRCEDVISPS